MTQKLEEATDLGRPNHRRGADYLQAYAPCGFQQRLMPGVSSLCKVGRNQRGIVQHNLA